MNIEDAAQAHEAQQWTILNMNRPGLPDMKKPGEPGYGPESCDKCGADMPDFRRANGWKLCTPCQSAQERPAGVTRWP